MKKRHTYIRTPEHRLLMSKILKGRRLSAEHRHKVSLHHADVSGDKNPNWKGGISTIVVNCQGCRQDFYTMKCRLQSGRGKFCTKNCYYYWMSIHRRGKNNPLWQRKDNIQQTIRKSRQYKQWRTYVYMRDNYTCTFCGLRGGWNKVLHKKIILNADHIEPLSILIRQYNIRDYFSSLKCKFLWDINNGRTLCVDCHKKTDTYLNSHMVKEAGYSCRL